MQVNEGIIEPCGIDCITCHPELELNTITISISEYENLLESARMLNALESAGVENWSGYTEAFNIAFPEDN